jgi:hypothetical protein
VSRTLLQQQFTGRVASNRDTSTLRCTQRTDTKLPTHQVLPKQWTTSLSVASYGRLSTHTWRAARTAHRAAVDTLLRRAGGGGG